MLRPIDQYFLQQEEPIKSCLVFLRDYLSGFRKGITEHWQYGMPFYYYNGKRFAYLWVDKKSGQPYIGIADGRRIDHPMLQQGKRSRMKILLLDPAQDLPMDTIGAILAEVCSWYA